MSKKKALIVYGGWDGHEPELVSERFKQILEDEGLEVTLSDTLEAYADLDFLKSLHLIVPIWTGGKLNGELCGNVSKALASGVGMAANHGGLCASFREKTEWQFITGGNWISHPGGLIDYKVEIVKNSSSPIVEGIENFMVFSEQYYLHIDPAVEVWQPRGSRLKPIIIARINRSICLLYGQKSGDNGRVFYNSLGHTDIVFEDAPASQELMRRGMLWAIEGKDIAIERNLDPAVFESKAKMY
jgi:type 1 glutamine amidotransferase